MNLSDASVRPWRPPRSLHKEGRSAMAHISVHPVSSETIDRGTRLDTPSPVAAIIQRLSLDLSGPSGSKKPAAEPAETADAEANTAQIADGRPSIAFLSRCIVLQSVGV